MAVELCDNEDERCAMVERQGSVVDGRGAERMIVRAIADTHSGAEASAIYYTYGRDGKGI